jgi:hypothetical protein
MKPTWVIKSVVMSIRDVTEVMFQRKQRKLLLVLCVLLALGLVLAIVSSSGVLAPFLYPLF